MATLSRVISYYSVFEVTKSLGLFQVTEVHLKIGITFFIKPIRLIGPIINGNSSLKIIEMMIDNRNKY